MTKKLNNQQLMDEVKGYLSLGYSVTIKDEERCPWHNMWKPGDHFGYYKHKNGMMVPARTWKERERVQNNG